MGFGDNEPPALRLDAFPATLSSANHFNIRMLTFIRWDVIKLDSSINGGPTRRIEIDSGRESTDFVFKPARSGQTYSFSAIGCAKAADGSTNHCSPPSPATIIRAAINTNSLKLFLRMSGVDVRGGVRLRDVLGVQGSKISIRQVMDLDV